jgi:hypothetical protein
MSNRIERPVFYESQILGAGDLNAAVDHDRGAQARHNRYLHLWGVANGLELQGKPADGVVSVTLTAGMAIDGTGREIIVSQDEPVTEAMFSRSLTGTLSEADLKKTWFPVFLVGRDEPATQAPIGIGSCNDAQPTRTLEGYEITFGKPGQELNLDGPAPSNVSDGPGDGAWKTLLVGFVQWSNLLQNFTGVSRTSKPDGKGVGPRYAGVQADEISARSGTLRLRTNVTDKVNKPTLVLDETNGGLLQFGTLDPKGELKTVFSVTAQGDLTVEGKLKGALTTGGVQIESGIATDGMILPLPPGITEKQVADGDAVVHIHVSHWLGTPSSQATSIDVPSELFVDAQRRVNCRVRQFSMDITVPTVLPTVPTVTPVGLTFSDVPGACHYMVLASVKEKK